MLTFAASLLASNALASQYSLASYYDGIDIVDTSRVWIGLTYEFDADIEWSHTADWYEDDNGDDDGYYLESLVNTASQITSWDGVWFYLNGKWLGVDVIPTVTFWDINLLDVMFYFLQAETDPCVTMGYSATFAVIDVDVEVTLPGCWMSFYDLIDVSDHGDCSEDYTSTIDDVWVKSFAPTNF